MEIRTKRCISFLKKEGMKVSIGTVTTLIKDNADQSPLKKELKFFLIQNYESKIKQWVLDGKVHEEMHTLLEKEGMKIGIGTVTKFTKDNVDRRPTTKKFGQTERI